MDFDNVKPFRAIVLVAFGILALAGLYLFSQFEGFDNGEDAVGKVEIWGTLPEETMLAQLDALKASRPEFVNVSYVEISAATFGAELAEALAIAEGPDMVLISQEQLVAERNKLSVIPYSELSQREYLNAFVPITELYLTDQGTYGIPIAVDPLVMYYNRTLLASAGIPQPPTTWEAVLGMSERLTQYSGGQITRSLIAFGEYSNVPNARAIISLLLLQAGTPITSTVNGRLESALSKGPEVGGESAAVSAISFYTQFSDPAKTVYSWNRSLPDARQAFLAGDLALYFGYASELPLLLAGNPNLDLDMAPVPQPSRSTTRTTYGLAYALAIPKTSKNPTGAYMTALGLADRRIAAEGARALSMTPASRAALSPSPDSRYEPVFYPEALVARGWLSPSAGTTDTIFAAMIGNITSGRYDVGQALTSAEQALNSAL